MKLIYQGIIYSKKNSKSIITNRRTGKPMIVASKKAKEYERLTRAKEIADIIRKYCPDGGTVSYDDLCERYRKLMEKVIH